MKKFNTPQGALSSRPKGRGFVEAIRRSLPRSSGLTGKRKMKRKLAKGTRTEGSRRQDGEGSVEWNSTIRSRNIGLAANGQNGREAPSSKLDGTGEEVAK